MSTINCVSATEKLEGYTRVATSDCGWWGDAFYEGAHKKFLSWVDGNPNLNGTVFRFYDSRSFSNYGSIDNDSFASNWRDLPEVIPTKPTYTGASTGSLWPFPDGALASAQSSYSLQSGGEVKYLDFLGQEVTEADIGRSCSGAYSQAIGSPTFHSAGTVDLNPLGLDVQATQYEYSAQDWRCSKTPPTECDVVDVTGCSYSGKRCDDGVCQAWNNVYLCPDATVCTK
jgi:hypothetical protein